MLVDLDEYLFETFRRQPLVVSLLLLLPDDGAFVMNPILCHIVVDGLGVLKRLMRHLRAFINKDPMQHLLVLKVASPERRVRFLHTEAALRVPKQLLRRFRLVVGTSRVLLHATSHPFVADDGVLRACKVRL